MGRQLLLQRAALAPLGRSTSRARALSSAAGLVTVTLGWAEALRRRYRQPISCIFNGYVAEDFPAQPSGPPPGDVVSIVYTGTLYSGDRDPSASFSAINLLGAERDRVVVHFYGPPREQVQGFAMAHGVVDRVFVHDPVSYKACLALQTSADILLLLQWNPKQDEGHVPAKLFEYLGARRPILLLGDQHGEPAKSSESEGPGSWPMTHRPSHDSFGHGSRSARQEYRQSIPERGRDWSRRRAIFQT